MEKYFFGHFFRQVEIVFKKKIRTISNSADPSCGYAGGLPPGRGVENARQDPGYPFCGLVSKTNFFEKICSTMTPPPGPPPGPPLDPPGPPHGPPIFFNFFFQFWITGAPFYIFFFYYITVFLLIFSLFLFTFFSIIECRAVVLQPPQLCPRATPTQLGLARKRGLMPPEVIKLVKLDKKGVGDCAVSNYGFDTRVDKRYPREGESPLQPPVSSLK